MEVYYSIVFFVFGLVFGSFFNVVGYRLPNKMSLIKPSSHCPNCNHKLSPVELIPVFSYLFQLGKCKNCKKKIPIFYPVFELSTGVLFLITYLVFGLSINTIIALIFISMILILIISDILYMVIPDELLMFCGILLFILEIINKGIVNIPTILLNILIPFVVMYLIKILGDKLFKKESLGGGDIKLMLVFGLVLGYPLALFSIVIASFIALPISLINLIKNNTHELPLGPYLGISAIILLLTKIDINTIIKIIGI